MKTDEEKCYEEIRNNFLKKVNTSKIDTKGFLKKSFEIHGDKYDYSKVNFVDKKTKVVIICPKHDLFEKTPKEHLIGEGCFKCQQFLSYEDSKSYIQQYGFKSKEDYLNGGPEINPIICQEKKMSTINIIVRYFETV